VNSSTADKEPGRGGGKVVQGGRAGGRAPHPPNTVTGPAIAGRSPERSVHVSECRTRIRAAARCIAAPHLPRSSVTCSLRAGAEARRTGSARSLEGSITTRTVNPKWKCRVRTVAAGAPPGAPRVVDWSHHSAGVSENRYPEPRTVSMYLPAVPSFVRRRVTRVSTERTSISVSSDQTAARMSCRL
jgi:hypothetical protein